MKSVFLHATNSGWYPEFLNSVIEIILDLGSNTKILDIGTGPGKLPELLIKRNPTLHITGIDTKLSMIHKAIKNISHKNILFQHVNTNSPFLFEDERFDVVTFCSVLFLVNDTTKTFLV